MKIVLLFLLSTIIAYSVIDLKPVDADNSVTFIIKNLGINTKGELKGLSGTIKWDAANPSNSSFNISVDVNTINTGIDLRDKDIKEEKYFDVANYPTINLKSTAVTATEVTGNLTMKGVTKTIRFPFTATSRGKGYLFEGSFSINRRDFNVGGGGVLGSNVDVTLKVQAEPL